MKHCHDHPDDESARCPHHATLSRRALLALGGGFAATAGCLGGDRATETPDPVAVPGSAQCDACGMVIADHPGPNGEIFYRDRSPEGHDNPAWFDSVRGCLFPYFFEHERLDWTAAAVYVTDYSQADYSLQTEGDRTFITSHRDPETLARASDVAFVVGADVYGAMGRDFVPFSDRDDADAFRAEHGGEILAFDEVTPDHLAR
jgi:nitrous oxide reductase accessory protein NosL